LQTGSASVKRRLHTMVDVCPGPAGLTDDGGAGRRLAPLCTHRFLNLYNKVKD
jgi:hypothetical protein